MKRTEKILILIVLVIFLLFLCISSDSGLKETHRRLIEIAFMNGYITAVTMDIEKIMEMKEDSSMLEQRVREETRNYLAKVEMMNKEHNEKNK